MFFDFYTLFVICKQSSQNISILVSVLNIWAKYEYFQIGMSENGTIHISMIENWVSHILFLSQMGLIYLAALKKVAIRAAHPYYVIYR